VPPLLRGRHQPYVDAEGPRQRSEGHRGRVGLPALDAADLGLIDSGHLGELLLCQLQRSAPRGELLGEGEAQAIRVELGDSLGAVGLSLSLQLGDEVVELCHAGNM